MNKALKATILFTALLLPVLIFLFLKMFGKNEFDIPVFNHTEIISVVPCHDIELPHTVDLKTITADIKNNGVGNIYHILRSENKNQLKQIMRVKDRFEHEEPKVTINSLLKDDSLINMDRLVNEYQINRNWKLHQIREGEFQSFKDCELMMKEELSLVLVDIEGRIRGYYDGSDLKDVDRLILETKILLHGDE